MNLAEKSRCLVMRSADDTNLSDCIAIAEKDQNMIWEELGDLEGRLGESNG